MTKNKKRIIIIFGILLLILSVIGKCYYHDSTFVEKNMVKYTGLKNPYIIVAQYYDNHQSFIEVYISIYDKLSMLERIKFDNDMKNIKGIPPEFISEKDNFMYHKIKRGERSYRYILIALEKKGNTMQVYEYYADH